MADVVLVHPGVAKPGGVSVDVRGLADGLSHRGHAVALASNARTLRRELRSRPRALVHIFGCLPSYTTFAAIAIARRARRGVVWTPVFHPSRRRTWSGYGWLRIMEAFDAIAPRAARFTDAVIAATEAEADYFRSLGPPRVALIPPGVEHRSDTLDEAELDEFRKRVGLDGGPVVLTVARENSRKALPFGIEAFRALRRTRPDAELLLVGADPERRGHELGVRCPGWLEPRETELAYRCADVLFVPSLYEGLPRSVIEAWSFALPVVATDRVALAPTIDGVGGRVIGYGRADDAAEALAALLDDQTLARTYGESGRRLVEDGFCLDRSVEQTASLYRSVAESSAEP
jgi:glycosyltransferase involved in cell wall biosynthesis